MTYKEIPGWFDFENFYMEQVHTAGESAIFVEVGAWFGKSTAFLANQIKQSKKNITLYVIDTWAGSINEPSLMNTVKAHGGSIFEVFKANMKAVEVDQIVKPIVSDSAEAAKYFADGTLDFVFIDAAHDYESVVKDIKAWLPKIKKGGVISGHDYCTYESVRLAVQQSGLKFRQTGNVWYANV